MSIRTCNVNNPRYALIPIWFYDFSLPSYESKLIPGFLPETDINDRTWISVQP